MKSTINELKIELNRNANELDKINNLINKNFALIEALKSRIDDYKFIKDRLIEKLVFWFFKSNITLVIVKFVPYFFGAIVPSIIFPIAYLMFFITFVSKNDYLIEYVAIFNKKRLITNINILEYEITELEFKKEVISKLITHLNVAIENQTKNNTTEQNDIINVKNDYINKPLIKR